MLSHHLPGAVYHCPSELATECRPQTRVVGDSVDEEEVVAEAMAVQDDLEGSQVMNVLGLLSTSSTGRRRLVKKVYELRFDPLDLNSFFEVAQKIPMAVGNREQAAKLSRCPLQCGLVSLGALRFSICTN